MMYGYHANNSLFSAKYSIIPLLNEPHCEKTSLGGFRPGPTQTRLYSHRRWLEA